MASRRVKKIASALKKTNILVIFLHCTIICFDQFATLYCYLAYTFIRHSRLHVTDLTQTGSEYDRVGAATEKALVPTFVLTLGTKGRLELDDRSCQSCLAGASSECKSAGRLDERA